jgi:hypothetical protein
MIRISAMFLFAATSMLMPSNGQAANQHLIRETIVGSIGAELVSVIDGDTVHANAHPWPQEKIAVLVRIRSARTSRALPGVSPCGALRPRSSC